LQDDENTEFTTTGKIMTTPINNMTDTWDVGATVYTAIKMTITDTAFAAGSQMLDITTAVGSNFFRVDEAGNISFTGYMQYAPIVAPAHSEGLVFYNNVRETLSYYNATTGIENNIGEEVWKPVWNDTGVQIDDGSPVYHILSRQMVIFCVERRKAWRILQSRVGVINHDYIAQKEIIAQIDNGEISVEDFLNNGRGDGSVKKEELKQENV